MSQITIISSDGEKFTIEKKIAERSILIKNMIADLAEDEDEEDIMEIPVPNVRASVLKKVIEWATSQEHQLSRRRR